MDFPRLVYKSAATHKLVANADEHAAALKDGWYASVPEALGQKAVAARPVPTPANLFADVDRRMAVSPRRVDLDAAAKVKGKKDHRRLVNRREADKGEVVSEASLGGTFTPPWGT